MSDVQNSEAEAPSPDASDASLDEALSKRFDELGAEPEEEPAVERDERGRFKPKEEASEEPAEAEEAPEEPEEEAEEAPEEQDDGPEAPAHLPQQLKDAWADLKPDQRKAFAEHQSRIDRQFSEQGRQLQAARPVLDVMQQAVQANPEVANTTPEQFATTALEMWQTRQNLDRDPIGTIMQVAQMMGATEHLKAALNGQQPSQQADYIANLQHELQGLKQQLSQLGQTDWDGRISAAMEQRETASVVQQFAAEQPHWADVEPHLPQFITIAREQQPEAPPQEVLKAAYDMATHAIPQVRAKLQATEKVANADPERARKAKKATSTNVRSTSTGKVRDKTMDEVLSETYDRINAD